MSDKRFSYNSETELPFLFSTVFDKFAFQGSVKMPSEMEDGGRYSQNNHMTFTVSKFVKSSLTQGVAASMSKVKESSQFTYCDFGAADGGMASVLAKTVVDEVLANDKRKYVNVFSKIAQRTTSRRFSPSSSTRSPTRLRWRTSSSAPWVEVFTSSVCQRKVSTWRSARQRLIGWTSMNTLTLTSLIR